MCCTGVGCPRASPVTHPQRRRRITHQNDAGHVAHPPTQLHHPPASSTNPMDGRVTHQPSVHPPTRQTRHRHNARRVAHHHDAGRVTHPPTHQLHHPHYHLEPTTSTMDGRVTHHHDADTG